MAQQQRAQFAVRPSSGPPSHPQQWQQQQHPAQHNNNPHYHQQQLSAEKKQVKDYFRKLLTNIEVGQPPSLNQEAANQISRFACMYHNLAAGEIASVIIEFIRDNPERQFVYLNVMDSIMKHVQGQYITQFASFIPYTIGLVLQRAQSANKSDEQKNLVKMFKTWEVLGLLDQAMLNTIAEQRALRQLEAQLLTSPEELQKIQSLKEYLEPCNLPPELIQSGKYICGAQISKHDILRKHQEAVQRQQQQYGATQWGRPNAAAPGGNYYGAGGAGGPHQQQNMYPGGSAGNGMPYHQQQQYHHGQQSQQFAMGGASAGAGACTNNYMGRPQQQKQQPSQGVNNAGSNEQATGAGQGGEKAATSRDLFATLMKIQAGGSTQVNQAPAPAVVDQQNSTKNGQGVVDALTDEREKFTMPQYGAQNAKPPTGAIQNQNLQGQQQPQSSLKQSNTEQVQQKAPQMSEVYGATNGASKMGAAPSPQVMATSGVQLSSTATAPGHHQSHLPSQVPGGASSATETAPSGSMMNPTIGDAAGTSSSDWRSGQRQSFAQPPVASADRAQSVGGHPPQQQQQAMLGGSHHAGAFGRHYGGGHQAFQTPAALGAPSQTALASSVQPGPHRGSASGVRTASNQNVQSNQKSVGFRQFGFLPSLLKSFTSFNKTRQLSLGNFIYHQATSTNQATTETTGNNNTGNNHPHCPSFADPQSLQKFSETAQAEIFQGVKFYCSICGMRFVRNLTLKEHLNAHFEQNLALKRRGDRTMARDQFQAFADFVAPRKHIAKQDGEAGGVQGSLKRDVVPYDGSKSHIATYNFCYLCKERLDTYHDDQDESWYFVDTRQVRFSKSLTKNAQTGAAAADQSQQAHTNGVVNVHTACLKEIEQLNFAAEGQSSAAQSHQKKPTQAPPVKQIIETQESASAAGLAASGSNTATKDQTMEISAPIVGQKRLYVNAAQIEESKTVSGGEQDVHIRGLQDIIRGLESQKRKRAQ